MDAIKKLKTLMENTKVWYHGTPEGQNFHGTFTSRTKSVRYITNPKLWKQLHHELSTLGTTDNRYMDIIDQIGKLWDHILVKSQIFFSDNHNVANSYADDRRAYDYQTADPRVISVNIDDATTLSINAHGSNFRGLLIKSLSDALSDDGKSDVDINDMLERFSNNFISDGSKITTDTLATMTQLFGYSIVDIIDVKDNYMGGGSPSIVRMGFDPALIHEITSQKDDI